MQSIFSNALSRAVAKQFAIPADLPPAAPKLAWLRPIAPQSYRQSPRARCGLPVHPDLLFMALQKVHRRNRCCPTSCPTLRPNPHSAAALPCSTSRDFLPWRFSNAGRRNAWIASSSRRPKTCTEGDSCSAAIPGSCLPHSLLNPNRDRE